MNIYGWTVNQAHGYTRHLVAEEQSVNKFVCGKRYDDIKVYWSEPNTLHSSLATFDCERCRKAGMK